MAKDEWERQVARKYAEMTLEKERLAVEEMRHKAEVARLQMERERLFLDEARRRLR